MSVCYGIAPQDMGANWECDLCANTHQEEAHLVSLESKSRLTTAPTLRTMSARCLYRIDQSQETATCRL